MLLTRLRLEFSHLNDHLFLHNFCGIDRFCVCNTNSHETTTHFLLRCPIHAANRNILFNNLCNNRVLFFPTITPYDKLLLFWCKPFDEATNDVILPLKR